MKYLSLYIVSLATIATLLLAGCDSDTITQQDNTPPLYSQTGVAGQPISPEAVSDSTEHNRYLVMFKQQPIGLADALAAEQAVQKTDAIFSALSLSQDSLIHQYKWASSGFAGHFSSEQVERLRKDPRVDHVVKDYYYKAIDAAPLLTIPMFNSVLASGSQATPWGVSRVGGNHDGTGTTAWVLDTGIDLDHPDLNVDLSQSASFVPYENADDQNGHGTHIAGIIGALDNTQGVVGVAAGASVVAVKVCDSSGGCFASDVKAGIDYVANNFNPGDVANLSLGYPVYKYDFYKDILLTDLDNSIINAANSGLKFTISAGNDKDYAMNYSPARIEHANVYVVSAFKHGDAFAISFDCNTTKGSNFGGPANGSVRYSAPGNNITSLAIGSGTTVMCGTSMAAPHIAGLLLALGEEPITDGVVSTDPDTDPDPIAYGALNESALITQSVQNDYAHFSWQTVAGAEEYDVYYYSNEPGAGGPDFQKIATTTSTSFTGLYLYSSGFGDPDFTRYSAQYYVVAVDANGNFNDSPRSNYATFNYYRESQGGGGIGL